MHRELAGLSRKDLLALARVEGIRGRHRLTRTDLVDALVATYRRLMDTPEALRSRTRRDLILLARALSVERRNRLRKDDLIESLELRWATSAESAGRRPAVERAKNGLTPSPEAWEDPKALPSGYGSTRLTLMPINPYRIHAYWEIALADLESARHSLGEGAESATTVLRVHDVTGINFDGTNARHMFDVEVGGAANWYLTLWSANRSYVGDLGLRAPGGHFVPLVRSNIVHTPGLVPSDRREELWVEVSWKARPILRPARGPAPYQEVKTFPRSGSPTTTPADRRAATQTILPGPPRVPAEKPPHRDAGPRNATDGETEVTSEGKEGLQAWPVEWRPAIPLQAEPEPPDRRRSPGSPPAIGERTTGSALAGTWTTSPLGTQPLFGRG